MTDHQVGSWPRLTPDYRRKAVSDCLKVAIATALPFSVINYLSGHQGLGILLFAAGICWLPTFWLIRHERLIPVAEIWLIGLTMLVFIALLVDGGIDRTGIYWVAAFPFAAFYVAGLGRGTIWIVAFALIYLTILILYAYGHVTLAYSVNQMVYFTVAYGFFSLLAYVFLTVRDQYQVLLERQVAERTAELEASKQTVESKERHFRSIFESFQDLYYRTDMEGIVTDVSPSCLRLTGYKPEKVLGRNVTDFYADPGQRTEFMRALRETGTINDFEVELVRKDGVHRTASASCQIILDEGRQPVGVEGILRDISERKKMEEKLVRLAHTDSLTGLPSRALFMDRLGQAIAQARRRKQQFAVLFIDLDRFKLINDSLGHEAGDQALKLVAEKLKQCVRAMDTVARLGGDEFTMILMDITCEEDAAIVARKVLDVLGRPIDLEDKPWDINGSIGISMFPGDGEDVDSLMNRADAAMYLAKRQGNTFIFSSHESESKVIGK